MPEAGASSLEPGCSTLGPARQMGKWALALRVAAVTGGEETGERGSAGTRAWTGSAKPARVANSVCAHTLTGMYTDALTLSETHTCVHTLRHIHTQTCTHTKTPSHIYTCVHAHTTWQAHTWTYSHTHTYPQVHLCMHTVTHMRTH